MNMVQSDVSVRVYPGVQFRGLEKVMYFQANKFAKTV